MLLVAQKLFKGMKVIVINSKKHGIKKVLVDDQDYDWLNQWKWCVSQQGNRCYVYRTIVRQERPRCIVMHRLILSVTDPRIFVDHRDHNTLNNQRENLRLATNGQNNSNKTSRLNSSSRYLGVSRHTGTGKWQAEIRKRKTRLYLGLFTSEEDAAIAYNKAAIELHGEFANLNKPDSAVIAKL